MKRPKKGFKTVKTGLRYISQLSFEKKRGLMEIVLKLLDGENGKKSAMKYFAIRLPQIVAKGARTKDEIILDTINRVTDYTF